MRIEPGRAVAADSFGTHDRLGVDGTDYRICRLSRIDGADRLPYGSKVLLGTV